MISCLEKYYSFKKPNCCPGRAVLYILGCIPVEVKISLADICVPSADFVSHEIKDSLVIVPLLNGVADADRQIYSLSETGRAIWHQLDGENTLGQVAAELSEHFKFSLKDIERDVLGIAAELLRRGICLKLSGEHAGQEQLKKYNNKECELSAGNIPDKAVADEDPASYIISGGELSLSNPGQLALLKSMAERGVSLRTTVRGFSMHPFIRDCDVLTITPLKGYHPELGDVVAFTRPECNRLVIHRIIKNSAPGWLIKGDNCPKADGLIEQKQVIGYVTHIERGKIDVHFGLGIEKKLIALLNRGSGLVRLKKLWRLPRRFAGFSLHSLQNLAFYRLLGRRLAPTIGITTATNSDLEEVHRRFNPFVPYRRQPPNPDVTNLVAKTGSKLAGFVRLVYHPDDHHPWTGFWLFSLYVWGRYRALGLGERLTRQVINEAKNKGAFFISLVVYEDNFEAINLYRKLGFSHITSLSLEPLLAAEKEKTGRRRIMMQKSLRCSDD